MAIEPMTTSKECELDAILDDAMVDAEIDRESRRLGRRTSRRLANPRRSSNRREESLHSEKLTLSKEEIEADPLIQVEDEAELPNGTSVDERLQLAKAHCQSLEHQLTLHKEKHQKNVSTLSRVQRFVDELFNNGLVDTKELERLQQQGQCTWLLLRKQHTKGAQERKLEKTLVHHLESASKKSFEEQERRENEGQPSEKIQCDVEGPEEERESKRQRTEKKGVTSPNAGVA